MTKTTRVLMLAAGVAATLALPAAVSAQAARPVTINLAVQNASGVSGTATLTDIGGGRTRVDVRVAAAGNTNMPAHIHEGTCANLNPAPKFPLTNVANGTSTTEVSATIAAILAAPHAINLHKSPTEASIYTSCGNVVAGAAALPATGGPASAVVPMLAAMGAALAGLAGFALRKRA
ncbi:MAG: LPXTG cell wall anchor domain-containing protein [Chloroflexota bacterium]